MHRYSDEQLIVKLEDAEKKAASFEMQFQAWNLEAERFLKEIQKRKDEK